MATGDKQASPQPVGQPQPGQQSGQIHRCTFLSGDVAERCQWRVADNTDRTICPQLLWIALPIGLVWCVAPLLLSWLSHQPVRKVFSPTQEQKQLLRQTSREIWAFFETFATAKENWLPPDNYQEIPQPTVAHRTSPTNIGLSLMANLTAWDFGYLPGGEVLRRVSLTLDTLDKLEHYRGHLYNWYDTRTLVPSVHAISPASTAATWPGIC